MKFTFNRFSSKLWKTNKKIENRTADFLTEYAAINVLNKNYEHSDWKIKENYGFIFLIS